MGLRSVPNTRILATKHRVLMTNVATDPFKVSSALLSSFPTSPVCLSSITVLGHTFGAPERILTVHALKLHSVHSNGGEGLPTLSTVLTRLASKTRRGSRTMEKGCLHRQPKAYVKERHREPSVLVHTLLGRTPTKYHHRQASYQSDSGLTVFFPPPVSGRADDKRARRSRD